MVDRYISASHKELTRMNTILLPLNCYLRVRADCFSCRFNWKLAKKSIATKDVTGYT